MQAVPRRDLVKFGAALDEELLGVPRADVAREGYGARGHVGEADLTLLREGRGAVFHGVHDAQQHFHGTVVFSPRPFQLVARGGEPLFQFETERGEVAPVQKAADVFQRQSDGVHLLDQQDLLDLIFGIKTVAALRVAPRRGEDAVGVVMAQLLGADVAQFRHLADGEAFFAVRHGWASCLKRSRGAAGSSVSAHSIAGNGADVNTESRAVSAG